MKKVNVLVPMAGQTMFFDKHKYPYPKSLIEIDEKTMIEHVINNLSAVHNINQFIFVVNDEDCRKHHLDNMAGLVLFKILKKEKPVEVCGEQVSVLSGSFSRFIFSSADFWMGQWVF